MANLFNHEMRKIHEHKKFTIFRVFRVVRGKNFFTFSVYFV